MASNAETFFCVVILSLGALLCFRIAWEEWKWPSNQQKAKPTTEAPETQGGER